MSLAQELGQSRSKSRISRLPWWNITKGTFMFFFLMIMMSQCESLSILATQTKTVPVLQVGKDKILIDAEELPELENQKLFVQEALEINYSASPWVPKELDEKCSKKPDCEQALGEEQTAFGHKVPTMQAFGSFLATPSYQPVLVKRAIANKPENFNKGFSTAYQVGKVSDPIAVEGKPGTFQTFVRGATFTFDPQMNPIQGVRDNYLVTFREAAKPSSLPKTPIQRMVSKIRARGYELVLAKPVAQQP